MKLYQNCFCLVLLLFSMKMRGQEFEQILPLSPNAASIVKQGDIPVSLFTGTPKSDSQHDIFYYKLLGESGKFFYNQESDQFITFPKSNLKILREGNNFRLTTQSGVEYSCLEFIRDDNGNILKEQNYLDKTTT